MTVWIIAAGVFQLGMALATGRAAADRGRSQWGGIWFGLILGLLGLSIVMLMAPVRGERQ